MSSFCETLLTRYGLGGWTPSNDRCETPQHNAKNPDQSDPLAIPTRRRGVPAKKWELVGMDQVVRKQSAIDRLRLVSLRGAHIVRSGDGEKLSIPALQQAWEAISTQSEKPVSITTLCSRVEELDLRDAGLEDWCVLMDIVQKMPSLHILDVSENKSLPSRIPAVPFDLGLAARTLRVLVLNHVPVEWAALTQYVLPTLKPTLVELHLESNGYQTLEAPTLSVKASMDSAALTLLNLSGNGFTSLEALYGAFVLFPNIEHLVLSSNPLASFSILDDAVKKVLPCQLQALSIVDCNALLTTITDTSRMWCLHQLAGLFPQLSNLKITYASILPPDALLSNTMSRHITVGQFQNLRVLNGSVVRDKERMDAEIFYLQKAALDWKQTHPEQFEEEQRACRAEPGTRLMEPHPDDDRFPYYRTYLARHSLNVLQGVLGVSPSFASHGSKQGHAGACFGASVVMVTLLNCWNGSPQCGEALEKKVPIRIKISQLRSIVRNVFGISSEEQKLVCFAEVQRVDREDDVMAGVELPDDLQDLFYYVSAEHPLRIEVHNLNTNK